MLLAQPALIRELDDGFFKYCVDFDRLQVPDDIGAICVSRPTNPSGNVLTLDELERLDALARHATCRSSSTRPTACRSPASSTHTSTSLWNSNVVLCLSLSKLGLPAARTGIVVADEADHRGADRVQRHGRTCATVDRTGHRRAAAAQRRARRALPRPPAAALRRAERRGGRRPARGVRRPAAAHPPARRARSSCGCGSRACRSAARNSTGDSSVATCWCCRATTSSRASRSDDPHQHECLRLSYAQPPESVRAGIAILAEEVRRAYERG